jgi:hypothetical protein
MSRDPRRVWLSRIAVVGKQVPVRLPHLSSSKHKKVKLTLSSDSVASRFWTVQEHQCKLANHAPAFLRRRERGVELVSGVPAPDQARHVSLLDVLSTINSQPTLAWLLLDGGIGILS